MDKTRCFKITPGARTDVDSVIIKDEGNWGNVLSEVEQSLDRQWSVMDDGEKDWADISVKVEGVEMTEDELAELEE